MFTGNWSGSGAYIKGYSRRSPKPYYKQLAASTKESAVSVDEYKLTVICSSCFHRTTKQIHVRNGRLKMISSAVVYSNVACPRRLITDATALNRDLNDPKDIAHIGFSSLATPCGLPLPPFRPTYNSNKQVVSILSASSDKSSLPFLF